MYLPDRRSPKIKRRNYYLKLHKQRGLTIWHNDNDDRWRTYLIHTGNKRKLVAKKNKKDLENFLEDQICKKSLSKDSYDAIKSLLNSLFDFAVLNEFIDRNPSRDVRSFGKSFWSTFGRKDVKHPEGTNLYEDKILYKDDEDEDDEDADSNDHLQFFSKEDQKKAILKALSFFIDRSNSAYLAIILNFCLWLRIAKLVALKSKDIDFTKNLVHIRRQEVPVHKDGKRVGCRISNKLKTANSNRYIPISPFAKKIFEMILDYNSKMGFASEYLFNSCTGQGRLTTESCRSALRKVNEGADLPQRSNHKIRKTVLSRLDMSRNFTLERIREIAGHARESMVLYTNYFYTIPDLDDITDCKTYEEVVDYGMPDISQYLEV